MFVGGGINSLTELDEIFPNESPETCLFYVRKTLKIHSFSTIPISSMMLFTREVDSNLWEFQKTTIDEPTRNNEMKTTERYRIVLEEMGKVRGNLTFKLMPLTVFVLVLSIFFRFRSSISSSAFDVFSFCFSF
jgi:hypothetical protein